MSNYIDSLLNNKQENFRKEIHDSLYYKIKEKLEDKKLEIASALYQNNIPEENEE